MNKMPGGLWFLARGPEAGRRFRMCGLLPSNHSISSLRLFLNPLVLRFFME